MFDLKAFRAELSLTQQELADLWGLRQDMISKWEREEMPPIAEYAARALKADLQSLPLQAKAALPPPQKQRPRLGRLPDAIIQGITND